MNKHGDFKLLKIQTHILKVNIHCHGCKLQVRKILHRTEGVFSVSIDVEEQKVTVSGDVDGAALIRKLNRAGKHAEPWPAKKKTSKEEDQRPNRSFRNQKRELPSSSSSDEDEEGGDAYHLRSLDDGGVRRQQFPMMVNAQACRTQSPPPPPPSMVMQESIWHLQQPQMMYLRSPAMAASCTGYYCNCYRSPYYLNDRVNGGGGGYDCYDASGDEDTNNGCGIM